MIIKEGVKEVGCLDSFFPNVKEIVLPASVNYLGLWDRERTYYTQLEKFTVDKENETYEAIDGSLYSKRTKKLLMVPIAKTKTGHFSVPEGTMSFGYYVFDNTGVTSISLPASFTEGLNNINLYLYNSNIDSVTVSKDNPNLCSIDGVLYNKAQTELVFWPPKKVVSSFKFPSTLKKLDCSFIPTWNQADSVTIPKALEKLQWANDNHFTTIKREAGNKQFITYSNILYKRDLSEIALYPTNDTRTSLTLKEGLQTLNLNVFSHTSNKITSVTLPKSLKKITSFYYKGQSVTDGFKKLSKITVRSGNRYFKTSNNVLYNKSMTELVWFPSNLKVKTYTVPKTVKKVSNSQLYRQNYLETINIHKNCTDLAQYASVGDLSYDFCEADYNYFYIGQKCPKLKAVNIASTSKSRFLSIDGVVCDREYSMLSLYPCGKTAKTYRIPAGYNNVYLGNKNPYLEKLILAKDTYCFAGTIAEPIYDQYLGALTGDYNRDYLCGFTKLKEFSVESGNKYFQVVNGGLYRMKELYAFPIGSSRTQLYIPSFMVSTEIPKTVLKYDKFTSIKVSSENKVFTTNGTDLFCGNKKVYSIG